MRNEAVLGIIGNTGPEADEILQRLIRLEAMAHGATKDQDFLPMIVVKNPSITDRTLAIFEGGDSPAIGIAQSCDILASCGVYLAALPSNTSHFFRDEYQASTDVYIIDLIALTSRALLAQGVRIAGILATTPTVKTGIYEKQGLPDGPKYISPSEDVQEKFVQSAIYGSLDATGRHDRRRADGLKSGCNDIAVERLSIAIQSLIEQDITAFVTACTEVSIVVDRLRIAFPQCTFIDPLELLAKRSYALTLEVKQALAADDIATIPIDQVLGDESLVARYVAGKISAHREA